jgi:putative endonuclease
MAEHNELGKLGEAHARKYLEKEGYTIVDTNWYFMKDELDIIALDGEELVIVEVKTRKENDLITPEEAVTKKKQRYLVRAANNYIEEKDIDRETRFDVMAITVTSAGMSMNHIRDAFYPTI